MKIVSTTTFKENIHSEIRFSALILAAGNSSRIGSDKASLPFEEGNTFVKYLVNSYIYSTADPVILIVNESFVPVEPIPMITTIVVNKELGKGKSHSIRLGIKSIPHGNACFIHNVDNPYVDLDLLRCMLSKLQPGSYVVPVNGNRGGHPVLLERQLVDYFRASRDWNDFRTSLGKFQKVEVPWKDERILLNINTLEDYLIFKQKT